MRKSSLTPSHPDTQKSSVPNIPFSKMLIPAGHGVPSSKRRNSLNALYEDQSSDEVKNTKKDPFTQPSPRNNFYKEVLKSPDSIRVKVKFGESVSKLTNSIQNHQNHPIRAPHSPVTANHNPGSPKHHSTDPNAERVDKNTNINNIIKKARNKIQIKKKDKTHNFEEKMKVFDSLATFVDIKATLQQMNSALNQKVEVESNSNLRHKRTESLPHLSLDMNSPLEKHRERMAKFFSRKKSQADFKNYLPSIESPDTKSVGNKLSKFHFDNERDIYRTVLTQATSKLEDLNDANLPKNEETDVNEFYSQLQDSLINNKFDRNEAFHIANVDVDRKHLEYYRRLLEYKPENEIDGKYYNDYKARADKVISLLKKATKNIYNKVLQSKPKKGLDGKEEGDAKDLKSNWKKNFSTFLTSDKYIGNIADFDANKKSIKYKFDAMMKKVSRLTNQQKLQWANPDPQDYTEKSNINHQINVVYKQFMNMFMDELDNQKEDYKQVKNEVKKRLNHMEYAYGKELEILHPKDMDSIRASLDTKIHIASFGTKAMKRYSKNILGAILSK